MSAAPPCPAGSGSGWRWPAPWYAGPRLLVLDDATSSVDPRIEREILGASAHRAGKRSPTPTVLVIAYRQATIALADEVVYLEDGRILGRGTHEELMATLPGYRAVLSAYESEMPRRPR